MTQAGYKYEITHASPETGLDDFKHQLRTHPCDGVLIGGGVAGNETGAVKPAAAAPKNADKISGRHAVITETLNTWSSYRNWVQRIRDTWEEKSRLFPGGQLRITRPAPGVAQSPAANTADERETRYQFQRAWTVTRRFLSD